MKYMNLGNSGLKVSRLCLGTMTYGSKQWRPWILDEAEARPFFKRAIEGGINFFDTADMYSNGVSEEVTGRALRELAPRDEVVIATKVFFPHNDKPNMGGLSRKHILSAIDLSLRRVGVDYVDLYQIHRFDYQTPIEETIDALDDVVRSGKARYIGASSMYAWQFAKMLHTQEQRSRTRFVSMQPHYNLIYREEEREMIPLCIDERIGVIPWSPLARGFLAGNRKRNGGGETARSNSDDYAQQMYDSPADFEVVDRIGEVAKERGVNNVQIALAWMLHKPGITAPIIGASKPHHLDDALAALDVTLSEDEIRRLEEPYVPHRVLGHK
jgi:aryl-alcohol dehydrogenase (NADP+)